MTSDPRLEAFLSDGEEVFNGVQQGQNLWKHDPFDVPSFNAPARSAFQRLLKRAVATPRPEEGKLLLLTGESGSGKTHLVRAFRHLVHGQEQGYVGYLPMTVDTPHYERYILSCLMDSLDRPYDARKAEASGLMRLSDAVMEASKSIFALNIQAEPRDDEHLHTTVSDVAYELRADPRFRDVSVDLLRALLFLQHRDVRLHHAVLQWIRCRDLSPSDAKALGNLVPRTDEDGPKWMLEQLGHLLSAFGQAFVLCVDQVEDISDFALRPGMEPAFRRAMNLLAHLAGNIPTAIVVVCGLSDFWFSARQRLLQSILDRIELDPAPVKLEHLVTAQTARDIAAQRLKVLYEKRGATVDPRDPTYPIPPEVFDTLSGRRTRDVLHCFRAYRERAIEEGRLPALFLPPEEKAGPGPEIKKPSPTPPPEPDRIAELDQKWADFRATFQAQVPDEDEEIVSLLAWGLETASQELDGAARFSVKTRDESSLEISPEGKAPRLLVVLCNRSSKGGHLGYQMKDALDSTGGKLPVLVRTTEFPSSTGTIVAEQLLRLQKKGGRRAVLGDGDLRDLVALRTFRQAHAQAALNEWSHKARPITRLKLISDLLGREPMEQEPPAVDTPKDPPVTKPHPQNAQTPTPPAPLLKGPLRLGLQEGIINEPVTLEPGEMMRHSAFLGGTGSGKTTAALNLVEQLLLRGIPAILVDRKGDLAGYAREEAWRTPLEDPRLDERRRLLLEHVDVALYTPGRSDGRPLAIPVVPRGLEALSAEERDQAVTQAADAIAGMLEYKSSNRDKATRALLEQALHLLVRRPRGKDVTLELLRQFIQSEDPALVREAEGLDAKAYPKLVNDLATLRLSTRVLLSATGERLDVEELLGRGASATPGRTRLSIISTKFLGGNQQVLFWVSQLLMETHRWASQNPSSQLQAVLLFDEADLYLPAVGKPATKQPMENLLRRARSAGLGLMLATQSPGDLDYKCRENVRTWLVGRVTEETALKKLKPMFANGRGGDGTQKLATQQMGRFHLQREGQPVQQLKADRNVILTEQLSEDEILRLARQTGARRGQGPELAALH
ncbi:helicase HerA-like domain-containing protein [Melittangium boletus]|uniref:TonB-dependent receptor n=1 Tax=Melittangium boletus DSM 14713 TaxID=1294270 RepID=A0A250ISM9_9BACT|nr:helicase HerA-like domain-containing protein [Melittangium boletus]ATB34187.1 TonB-dependent receptor [Melittangium boletus DSM 14713]